MPNHSVRSSSQSSGNPPRSLAWRTSPGTFSFVFVRLRSPSFAGNRHRPEQCRIRKPDVVPTSSTRYPVLPRLSATSRPGGPRQAISLPNLPAPMGSSRVPKSARAARRSGEIAAVRRSGDHPARRGSRFAVDGDRESRQYVSSVLRSRGGHAKGRRRARLGVGATGRSPQAADRKRTRAASSAAPSCRSFGCRNIRRNRAEAECRPRKHAACIDRYFLDSTIASPEPFLGPYLRIGDCIVAQVESL